ncbi:MAG TPA: DUF3631 domain-containing protein [Pseudonocardiaceae bacterium]|jgi:hypothetical protein|nr:DUF3631 domain-containing protein [Pseudonocardiaceae bacterium]
MTTAELTTTDGAVLLDQLHAALTTYVILPTPEAADAVTLWIAATHAQPAWAHAPRLVIRGPEKRCGKSRLLDIVEATCHNPLITVNASPAAVYRSITDDPPTMLVDEADTIFGPKADGNEDLRGLLNAGHQRNRPAVRYEAASNRVITIPTFCMAALAGIGAMPDTIEDRAVVIRMRRKAPGEKAAPYRHRRDRPGLQALTERLSEWMRADLVTLERAEPAMPVEDRAADTWEPLVVVADYAGGPWPDRARTAVLTLTTEAAENGQVSTRIRLLADCRTAFDTDTALATAVLLDRLKADPDTPWLDYGPAGLTAAKLGALLREYDIRSANIRFPDGAQAKGYQRADFADAWTRYCPASEGSAGGAVPAVPRSSPQVQPGRLAAVGRLSRPERSSRPAPISTGTPGTAGDGNPLAQPAEGAA